MSAYNPRPEPIVMPQPPEPAKGLMIALHHWQCEPAPALNVRAEVHLDLWFSLVRRKDHLEKLRRRWSRAEKHAERVKIEHEADTTKAWIARIESQMAAIGLPANVHQNPPSVRRANKQTENRAA